MTTGTRVGEGIGGGGDDAGARGVALGDTFGDATEGAGASAATDGGVAQTSDGVAAGGVREPVGVGGDAVGGGDGTGEGGGGGEAAGALTIM